MNFTQLKNIIVGDIKTHGVSKTMYDLTYRGANHITSLMVLKCITIDTVDPAFLQNNNNYNCTFISPENMIEMSSRKEYRLERPFLDTAINKGDECFAIMDGEFIASYGWYSNKPTKITDELMLNFNNQYVYMYNGYTNQNYRGQRLHAIGMTMALDAYIKRGFKGLISFVEANNYDSLRSCYRMGYRDFGEVFIAKAFKKYIIQHSHGCQDYGFRVEPF